MNQFVFGLFGLGTSEIIVIVIAILILFGAKKIPQFAKGLGQGVREFKDAAGNVKKEIADEARQVNQAADVNSSVNAQGPQAQA
jgi:sec-independent protein translocase protein TatA